ncbi:MAG TPA: Lrp/AsnC family transcriptional regulator [Paludibacteraceae bacterium]|nr:Lrp/AsnC family transcriptional regulator [Paludibacteraceae bacterium]
MYTPDKIDLKILAVLQENANLKIKELAAEVGLSVTPVFDRLKRLEKEGFIKKYTVILDADKLNIGFVVFCTVKMKMVNEEINKEFVNAIDAIPEITECYNISGEYDYLLKVHASSMETYRNIYLHTLGKLNNVASIQSIFVMDESKHEYGLPVKY